jgi:hypothetical protein
MARLPPALLGPSLAGNSAFQSALRPFFNIKLVKDRNFVPDVVLSAFSSEEVTLSAVWLEGASAFQTPEAVEASIER